MWFAGLKKVRAGSIYTNFATVAETLRTSVSHYLSNISSGSVIGNRALCAGFFFRGGSTLLLFDGAFVLTMW